LMRRHIFNYLKVFEELNAYCLNNIGFYPNQLNKGIIAS
jgi:hypothetical protein